MSQKYQLGYPAPTKDSIAETLYARFLNKFGLPSIADVNMVSFALSLSVTRDTCKRVEAFAQFAFEELPIKVGYCVCAPMMCIVLYFVRAWKHCLFNLSIFFSYTI